MDNSSTIPSLLGIYLSSCKSGYVVVLCWYDESVCVIAVCVSFADMMGMKRMMEKLGVPKTHLEMKKMISEVTGGCSDTINYRDFVKMMLGKRSAVLKL